jgi:hypothetical protein
MFVNNLRCRFSFNEPKLHKSALPIYPTVGMAASTLRHYFGQPVEVCTSCTLTLLQTTPTKRTRSPRQIDSKYPCTASIPHRTSCFSP